MSARGTGATRASTSRPDPELLLRRGLLLVVAAAALTAVLGGLARMGVPLAWGPSYALHHGPVFVLGVFGTVIALERAVALGHPAGYAAPVLGAVAAVAMLMNLPWAAFVSAASAVALVGSNVAIVKRQRVHFTWLMLLGSIVLAVGAGAWAAGRPVSVVVPAWMAFFVLTIVAERLELSRLAPTPRWASRALVMLALLFALSTFAFLLLRPEGELAFGASMSLLGLWQLRFDLARRTIRQPGLPRFAATGVMLGALWLVATGALLVARATTSVFDGLPVHDAILHGVFVGYVLSMVFAHAPIILPAVARVRVPFSRALYVPLAVLHLGLVLRVAGDLLPHHGARAHGGIANGVALGLFALTIIGARFVPSRRSRA